MATLICANGHRWPGLPDASGNSRPACPVCGALPRVPTDEEAPTEITAPPTNYAALPPPSPGVELAPGTIVAGYEILHLLGRGGMGVVYKACQLSLKRIVALKMLHPDKVEPAAFTRFRREAEAIARLQHPQIVQIYEIGEHAGRPFFSLEYVEGGSLARQMKRNLPSLRQAAHLIETLARAIQHAHLHGIVHRDLKPGNVLLQKSEVRGQKSEVGGAGGEERIPTAPSDLCPLTSDLCPKITDFGLAKYFDEPEEPLTQSGVVLGTPNYMAPEQATGDRHRIGPATDIYGLGAILYELLTGRPPFEGTTPLETVHKVVHEEPAPPRLFRDGLPRDLETICLKCLRKDPAARYAGAQELAEDLQRFLAGASIRARPPGFLERLVACYRRRPLLAGLLGLGGLTGGGLLLGAFWIDALAVGAIVVVTLAAAAGWYGAGLRSALGESKRQHLRAERNAQRLFLLLEATNRLMTIRNPDDLLHLLSETTTRLLDAERATIYLVDESRNELWSKVALGDDVGEIRVPLGQGIAGVVARTGETVIANDPYADPRFNAEVDRRTGYVTRNLLTLPMRHESGRVLGVFQAVNKRGGNFGQEDVEILGSLAAAAARAVGKKG